MSASDSITIYLESLPDYFHQFLGPDVESKQTLDEVQASARKAVRTQPSPTNYARTPAAPSGKKLAAETNALNTKSMTGDERYNRQQERGMRCYHCGEHGHILAECPIYKSGKPQTPAGQIFWAERQRTNGTNYTYDADKQMAYRKLREQYEERVSKLNGNDAPGRTTDRPRTGGGAPRGRGPGRARFGPGKGHSRLPGTEEDADDESPQAVGGARTPGPGTARHDSMHITVIEDKNGGWLDESQETTIQYHDISVSNEATTEKEATSSLSVPVTINGVNIGPALVDQGANHSLMRRSAYERHGLSRAATLFPIAKFAVITASGHTIPIIGRFAAEVTAGGKIINDSATVYVVDDKQDRDINCDVVLGRHTLAHGAYRSLDTLLGRLMRPDDTSDYVQCHPSRTYKRKDGRYDIGTEGIPPPDEPHAEELPVWSLGVKRLERRHRQRGERREHVDNSERRQQLDIVHQLSSC